MTNSCTASDTIFVKLHMQELDEILVNLPAGFRARIGLNETTLTRALARGEFSEAESIILDATDPEFLNDGALAATPLNMVLTGRSSYYHQSRNLKLARLLLEKGANPNLRIPNHDMESASQSPLELLLRYYLKLIQVFGLPGSCRTSYSTNSFEETELMDTIGINGETTELGPAQVTCQARRLLDICLDCGGDPNLPTTEAAKTIFHMAVTAPCLDLGLVERLLQTGVNVNIADVHNTTPIMDVISLGDEARSVSSLSVLASSNQAVILQLENCSRQSAVWRSVFQGHRGLTRTLESRMPGGAGPTCSGARVEPVCPARRSYRQSSIKSLVPAVLAPLLSDSPCYANLHVNTARRRQPQLSFSSQLSSHVVRLHLAPHVDRGELQGEDGEVNSRVASLVSSQTEHSCAGDSSVVDSHSLLPLMFGQVSAGLRQLAVRTILSTVLFNCSPELANKRLDEVCETQGFMLTELLVKPSLSRPKLAGEGLMSYEYEIELGNEMEVSFGRRNDDTDGEPVVVSESIDIAVSDRSSSQTPASLPGLSELEDSASDLMETITKLDRELEAIKTECVLDSLDRDLANWESELVATLDRIQTYHAELGSLHTVQLARRRSEELMEELRLQRMLIDSSSRDIEDLETSLADVEVTGAGEDSSARPESVDLTRRMLDDNWSLGAARYVGEGEGAAAAAGDVDGAASLGSVSPGLEVDVGDSSPGSIREYRETLVQTLTVAATYSEEPSQEETEQEEEEVSRTAVRPRFPRLVESDLSSSDSEDSESLSSSESDTWGGTFSLRHTRPSQEAGQQEGPSQASIVARLSPRTLFALTDHIGIPHSLRPVFSVEAARLQLCLALHSHRSIGCDRNCEGEESDTEESETEDWLHSDTDTEDNSDEPDIVPHLTDSDSDHSHSYDEDDDEDDDGQSSESSLSNFSQRSWYGSLSGVTEGRQLTPLSTPPALTQSEDSDSEGGPGGSWLEDREDFRRVRQFLQSGPGPDFTHSTDSESLSE